MKNDAEFLRNVAESCSDPVRDRLRDIAGRLDDIVEERKDWARRFMLDGDTPMGWEWRALNAERALARCHNRIEHRNDCETRKLSTMFRLRSRCTCGSDDIESEIDAVIAATNAQAGEADHDGTHVDCYACTEVINRRAFPKE